MHKDGKSCSTIQAMQNTLHAMAPFQILQCLPEVLACGNVGQCHTTCDKRVSNLLGIVAADIEVYLEPCHNACVADDEITGTHKYSGGHDHTRQQGPSVLNV